MKTNSQLFNVPPTAEGHEFLRLARKFLRKGYLLKARGRGPRKKVSATKDFLPISLATNIAVYLQKYYHLSNYRSTVRFQERVYENN